MAKRNIRKTDPEIVTTPDRREASAADPNGRAAAPKTSRSRRKADAPVAAAATQPEPATEVTPITAEGAIETPAAAATPANRISPARPRRRSRRSLKLRRSSSRTTRSPSARTTCISSVTGSLATRLPTG